MESASEMPNDILEIITSTDIYWAITRLRPCLSVSTYWTLIRPLRDGYFDYPHWTLEGPGDFQSSQAPTFNKWRRQALPSCSSRLEQSPASLPIMSRCQTLMCFQTTLGACGQVNSQASPLDSSKSLSVQSPHLPVFSPLCLTLKAFLGHSCRLSNSGPPSSPQTTPSQAPISSVISLWRQLWTFHQGLLLPCFPVWASWAPHPSLPSLASNHPQQISPWS